MQRGRTSELAAVSCAEARDLTRRYLEVPVAVVENGVDLERFAGIPRREADGTGALRIVVVAGDFERKGVPLAIRAVARTKACRLRVLGDGDRRAMRSIAAEYGALDRIEVLPPRADVEREFADADVVLSCSLYESFGLALVEGAAAGCAVVCTDTGVGPELVADDGAGAGGFVVPLDELRIGGALEALAEDRPMCARMGAAAAARAARFSWDEMTARTLACYDELVKRGS
jgi:glycosyltransferase involved in cell wall biosynthesis